MATNHDNRPATVLLVGFPDPEARALGEALPEVTFVAAPDPGSAAKSAADRTLDLVAVRDTDETAVRRLDDLRDRAPIEVVPDSESPPDRAARIRRAVEVATLRRDAAGWERTAKTFEDLAVLGRLSAGILHEVANALDSGRRWVRMSLREGASDDDRRRWTASAGEALDRAAAVLRTSMDFARGAAVRDPPRALAAIVDEALRLTEDVRGGTGTRLALEPISGEVPGALLQVVVNLLRNAYRACAGTGEVRIVARKEVAALRLTVEDDGAGFDPDTAARLFEPFFRSAGGPGTGLGLTISRRILERSGGTLSAHSDGPGRGARFTAVLPVAEVR